MAIRFETAGHVLRSKISARDVYDRLWKSRDFELSHLWQRSVVLTAFLVLTYSGYGLLIGKLFANGNCQIVSASRVVHCFAILISSLGLLVSFLWVLMGRGSKRWYEAYEESIDHFCEIYSEEFEPRELSAIAGSNPLSCEQVEKSSNDKVLSLCAGRYSPSKINIAIGWLSMSVWGFVELLHIVLLSGKVDFNAVVTKLFALLPHSISNAIIPVILVMCTGAELYFVNQKTKTTKEKE